MLPQALFQGDDLQNPEGMGTTSSGELHSDGLSRRLQQLWTANAESVLRIAPACCKYLQLSRTLFRPSPHHLQNPKPNKGNPFTRPLIQGYGILVPFGDISNFCTTSPSSGGLILGHAEQ